MMLTMIFFLELFFLSNIICMTCFCSPDPTPGQMIVNFMQQAEAQNNATLPTHNKGDMGNNHTGSADVKSEDIPGKLYVS